MWMNGDIESRVRQEENREQLRQAARWRLLREAGLVHGDQLKRSACRLLCRMGRALVALGEQLQQVGQPQLASR